MVSAYATYMRNGAMRAGGRRLVTVVGLLGLGLLAGCASSKSDASGAAASTGPHLLALSTYSASLGTAVDGFIANPPSATASKVELVFDGVFKHPDGKTEPVSLTQEVDRTEAGAVRWTSFGPFSNPFTQGAPDIGVFTGKVGVRFTGADGSVSTDAEALPVSFEVKPSIVVTDLQPVTATCGKPALRLIGAMAYKMKTTTIGFTPTSIDYSFTMPSVVPDASGLPTLDVGCDGNPVSRQTQISHGMSGLSDIIQGGEALTLPPVPDAVPSYGVVFNIVARDASGHQVATTFGMTAHKPLEVYYDGRFQLSQIYAATPVSSCIPGGQQGRTVDYSEATAETRSRTLDVTLSKTLVQSAENNWSTSDGKTVTQSATTTDGFTKTHGTQNSFTFEQSHSNSNSVSFNWSDSQTKTSGWEAGGEAGFGLNVPLLGGVDTKAHYNKTGSTANTSQSGGGTENTTTNGWSQGQTNSTLDQSAVDHSTATTDATAVSKTNTTGGANTQQNGTGQSNSDAWTVSSTDTIQRGFTGQVIANSYGAFYRQLARYTSRAFVLEYNKCGEADVVGEVTLQDYVWAPDLALGNQCPPLPVSNFPQPQCLLPPCDP